MSAVPIAIPLAWSTTDQKQQQWSRTHSEIGSDCLTHQEILR